MYVKKVGSHVVHGASGVFIHTNVELHIIKTTVVHKVYERYTACNKHNVPLKAYNS
jgi:hypothetical protein